MADLLITFSLLPEVDGLIGPLDVSTEEWREYFWPGTGRTYHITNPVGLYRRDGGSTHRIVDTEGVVHCVPCGPQCPDTVIRWKNKDITTPVNW